MLTSFLFLLSWIINSNVVIEYNKQKKESSHDISKNSYLVVSNHFGYYKQCFYNKERK